MEIEAKWRRVWQVRPYETEEVELKLAGSFDVELDSDGRPIPAGAAVRVGKSAAQVQRALVKELSAMGDQIMAERLKVQDPRGAPLAGVRR